MKIYDTETAVLISKLSARSQPVPDLQVELSFDSVPDDVARYFANHALSSKISRTAQQYGPYYANQFIKLFGMKKVPIKDNSGDAYHDTKGFVEIKVSISDNGTFSIQQIRTYQNIDNYLIFLCGAHPATNELFTSLMLVPANIVHSYAATYGRSSHKTHDKILKKENREMGLGIPVPSSTNGTNHILTEFLKYKIFAHSEQILTNDYMTLPFLKQLVTEQ